MKNILSFNGKTISGREIKDWIFYHIEHETSYSRIAKSMVRYVDTLVDNRLYRIELSPSGTGCGEKKRYKPNVILVE